MRESSRETVGLIHAKGLILTRISDSLWKRGYDKTVETKSSETLWPVYERYELRGVEGSRYILMPERSSTLNTIAKQIDPRASEHADLFLKFARWFDKQKMDKGPKEELAIKVGLDTPRNAEAALKWAHEYGVLGLGTRPNESFAVAGSVSSSAEDIVAERLGRSDLQHPDPGTRAYSKGRTGGRHETVENFVVEAYVANIVLKLYEAATAPTVDMPNVARFMSKRKELNFHLPTKYRSLAKTEREKWSGSADDARYWALAVVEDAVARKVENDVYPILVGEPGLYKGDWGFKSLLAAMWFQMREFMLGEDNQCPVCWKLFPKTRRNKTYCSDQCGSRARAAKAYERKKRRAEERREATRKKLRG